VERYSRWLDDYASWAEKHPRWEIARYVLTSVFALTLFTVALIEGWIALMILSATSLLLNLFTVCVTWLNARARHTLGN
jgi:antibiotic biosynthesis monooxygenase (ABM) superfamily enzyme